MKTSKVVKHILQMHEELTNLYYDFERSQEDLGGVVDECDRLREENKKLKEQLQNWQKFNSPDKPSIFPSGIPTVTC
jgi:regulator of replication initiation timing